MRIIVGLLLVLALSVIALLAWQLRRSLQTEIEIAAPPERGAS